MEGTLYKWTNFFMGWRLRYIVLKSSILYIHEKKGDTAKTKIHLEITEFIKQGRQLIILDCGIQIIHLKAESTEIRDAWFNTMKDAKNKYSKKEKLKNNQEEIELCAAVNINEDNFGTYIENNYRDRNSYIKIDYTSQRDTSRIISPNISPSKFSTNEKRNSINFTENFNYDIDANFLKNLKKMLLTIQSKIEKFTKNNVLLNFFISSIDNKKKILDLKNELIPIYYENKEDISEAMTVIEELLNTILAFKDFKENNSSTSPTILNKSPDVLKNENSNPNRRFDTNNTSNEGKSCSYYDENNTKKASINSDGILKQSNFQSNTNFNSISNSNNQLKKHNKVRNYSPINNFDYNSINSNNGRLITLNECKVGEEADDEDEGQDNIINYISNTVPNEIYKRKDKGNVLTLPDEFKGTVYYEPLETHNLHTKLSINNQIIPQMEHNSFEHVSLTLENRKNEENSNLNLVNENEDMSIIKNASSYINTYSNMNINTYKEKESSESHPTSNNTNSNSIDETLSNIYCDTAYYQKRFSLPLLRDNYRLNIWSVLKDSIGKGFSKIKVPIFCEEPLSLLQRQCENFQFSDLLNRAAYEDRSYMRLCLVTAFCIGGYSFHKNRFFKPLNPILGETYEYIDDNLKFRFFAEQVSIDPLISAVHVEGEGYMFNSNLKISSNHQIKKDLLEISTSGQSEIYFQKFDEVITFSKPRIIIKNFCSFEKKLVIQLVGKLIVYNNKTKEKCEIIMNEGNDEIEDYGNFSGNLYGDDGKIFAKIEGNVWSHINLFIIKENFLETVCVYKNFINSGPEKFYFNEFISNLNHLSDDLRNVLPPTDSRLRKDLRALELQDYERALKEQKKIEENERNLYKSYVDLKMVYQPKYFVKEFDNEKCEIRYIYSGDYWLDRNNKNLQKFPKLFS